MCSPLILHFLDQISFPDTYRAQFYLEAIEESLRKLVHLACDKDLIALEALIPFFNALVDDVDRSIAPLFAYEIALAKQDGRLTGTTSSERYRSFFISSLGWTSNMRIIRDEYAAFWHTISQAITNSVNNLFECLTRFENDRLELNPTLLAGDSRIARISTLSADRHRGGRQPLLLEMESGTKLVYKPTDLTPNVLWGNFIEQIDLPRPFDLRYARVVAKEGYGWIEFVLHSSCQSEVEVEDYYRRAGVLLAVADFLNYTDGHAENLIASGPYPVLIDLETLFQPGMDVIQGPEQHSILFTRLIQSIPDDVESIRLGGAIQMPSDRRVHLTHPHVLNDQTDEMQIIFKGVAAPNTQNIPRLNQALRPPQSYVEFIVEGYKFGFDRVIQKAEQILSSTWWWAMLRQSRPRYILRPTVYYAMLIRLLQQPIYLVEPPSVIQSFLRKSLNEWKKMGLIDLSQFVDYEIADLIRFDIPFFYHDPTSCSIFDGQGHEYPNFFTESAAAHLKRNLVSFNKSYLDRSVDIIYREIERAGLVFR